MLTLQEIFDIAVGGCLRQGCRSMTSDGGTCLYNGPDGRHCAAGFVFARLGLEVREYVRVRAIASETHLRPEAVELLSALQRVHDCEKVEDWASCFRYVGKGRELNTSVCDGN